MTTIDAKIREFGSGIRHGYLFLIILLVIVSVGLGAYAYSREKEELKPEFSSVDNAMSDSQIQATLSEDGIATESTPPAIDRLGQQQVVGRTIRQLVQDLCNVEPMRLLSESDSYIVYLPESVDGRDCLDDVVLRFDRLHVSEPQIIFEFDAADISPERPILHINAIYDGAFPYLHLRGGRTIYVGASYEGWILTAIDQSGVEFERNGETFRLDMSAGDDTR